MDTSAEQRAFVLLHTNYALSRVGPHSAQSDIGTPLTGWWADERPAEAAEMTRLWRRAIPRSRWLLQSFKYEWALHTLQALGGGGGGFGAGAGASAGARADGMAAARDERADQAREVVALLTDTDTIQQCSAAELFRRFKPWRARGVEMLVGAEAAWFPKPRYGRADPWPAAASGRRYPNSGVMLGTRDGFAAVVRAMRAMPRFPCCNAVPQRHLNDSSGCTVEDQHCLQAALYRMAREAEERRSEAAAPSPSSSFALDANASVILNLDGLPPSNLLRDPATGLYRLRGTPSDAHPCVIHFNGHAKGDAFVPMAAHADPLHSWVPRPPVKRYGLPAEKAVWLGLFGCPKTELQRCSDEAVALLLRCGNASDSYAQRRACAARLQGSAPER